MLPKRLLPPQFLVPSWNVRHSSDWPNLIRRGAQRPLPESSATPTSDKVASKPASQVNSTREIADKEDSSYDFSQSVYAELFPEGIKKKKKLLPQEPDIGGAETLERLPAFEWHGSTPSQNRPPQNRPPQNRGTRWRKVIGLKPKESWESWESGTRGIGIKVVNENRAERRAKRQAAKRVTAAEELDLEAPVEDVKVEDTKSEIPSPILTSWGNFSAIPPRKSQAGQKVTATAPPTPSIPIQTIQELQRLPSVIARPVEPEIIEDRPDSWDTVASTTAKDEKQSSTTPEDEMYYEDERPSSTTPKDRVYDENGLSPEAIQRVNATVMVLFNGSKTLQESDFLRVGAKGKHIENWAQDIIRVIPARDPATLEMLGHYFILFTNQESAKKYRDMVVSLHRLARQGLNQQLKHSQLSPGFAEAEEERTTAMTAFTLVSRTLDTVSMKLIRKPYSLPLQRLLIDAGPVALRLVPLLKGENSNVLFTISTPVVHSEVLLRLFRLDGEKRNMPWQYASNGDTSANLSVFLNLGTTYKTKARWAISFKDQPEAHRFIRAWHNRTVKNPELGINEYATTTAQFLW